MKNCINCNTELTENNWSEVQKSNWINKCKECIKTEKREYQRNWNKNNRLLSSKRTMEYKKRLSESNPIKARAMSAYSDCRKRAIKSGWDFDLTPKFLNDLMIETKKCPFFDIELTFSVGKEKTLASVDRIDSTKGYTKDNVQIISYLANVMKSNASNSELINFANGILRMASR